MGRDGRAGGAGIAVLSGRADHARAIDSFGLLFVLILAAFVATGLDLGHWNGFVLAVCFGVVIVAAMRIARLGGRPRRVIEVVVALAVLLGLLAAEVPGVVVHDLGYLYVLVAFAAPVVVLGRVLQHPVVGFETIMGALDAYLLLGLAFAVLYGAMNNLSGEFFAQKARPSAVDFLYFSFTVLTTLGFGDLTPRTELAKIVVPIEAVLGQIFLVVIVAGLVTSLGRGRSA